jgi:hypothetical protein
LNYRCIYGKNKGESSYISQNIEPVLQATAVDMIIDATMDTNTSYWLNRVAAKFYQLYLKGIDFDTHEYQWVFDWNDSLDTDDNLKNCAAEDGALTLLTEVGAVKIDHKKNFYRDQQLESLADPLRGFGVWGDWDNFHPARREYEYIRIVYGLDWGKFVEFCEEHGISYKEDHVRVVLPKKVNHAKDVSTDTSTSIQPLTLHKLEPRHYSQRTGILSLSATVDISVATKGKVKRPNGEKYLQCMVLEKLFKTVKTIKSGINFSKALSVSDAKIGKREVKKISNTVAEINKKVAAVGGPNNLIIVQNKTILVNNSYL